MARRSRSFEADRLAQDPEWRARWLRLIAALSASPLNEPAHVLRQVDALAERRADRRKAGA